jgi:hypothetical protein
MNRFPIGSTRRPALAGLILLSLLVSAEETSNRHQTAQSQAILADYFHITRPGQLDYPLTTVLQGCSRVDCIVSIDSPSFQPAQRTEYLRDDDLVLAVTLNGESRVYPAKILQRHEIVNDRIADIPFAVTYCPLCGTGEVFERRVNGSTRTFGVSGLLHGSDLIMYDRQHKNLWQQITGRAFAGPERGTQLKRLPVVMTDWKSWRKNHPDSRVLVPAERDLKDLYAAYRNSEKVMYGGKSNPRLSPKKVVFGLENGSETIAVTQQRLARGPVEFVLDGRRWRMQQTTDGSVQAVNLESGQTLLPRRAYWFAWFTFHPETRLIGPESLRKSGRQ